MHTPLVMGKIPETVNSVPNTVPNTVLNAADFIDYYDLLQISVSADMETVHRAYEMLVERCDPKADAARIRRLEQAHETLTDKARRVAYDSAYQQWKLRAMPVFRGKQFAPGIEGERGRRMGLLFLLYQRRRMNPEKAGLPLLALEKTMATAREHLLFSLWYLKESRWIEQDEHSDYVITGAGVDHFEASVSSIPELAALLKRAEAGESEAQQ